MGCATSGKGGRVWGSVPPPERAHRINRTARANAAGTCVLRTTPKLPELN
jgi:hypothetical protein